MDYLVAIARKHFAQKISNPIIVAINVFKYKFDATIHGNGDYDEEIQVYGPTINIRNQNDTVSASSIKTFQHFSIFFYMIVKYFI